MARPPKIVKEHVKEPRVMPPPPKKRIIYPEVLSKARYDMYLARDCMERIIAHCRAHADDHLEVMGLLVGDVYAWDNGRFTLVKDVVTTDLEATSISVRFDSEGFEGLFSQLDCLNYDYVLVGWYHSHPGLGCFMSPTDITTQRRMFNSSFHSALVVDPIKGDIKAYKLKDEGYTRRQFAIYSGKGSGQQHNTSQYTLF
jgi:proteasome lid subunit RPN8/RPN11